MPDLVRCMFSDTAAGGVASVRWFADLSPRDLNSTAAALLAGESAGHVQVFVIGGNGNYLAESYSPNGTRIKFCGHGALAAAWVLLNGHESNTETLQFSNADRSWQARRSGDDAADIELTYERPALQNCAVPDFAALALGLAPVFAAKAGGAQDYFIFELADADSLRALQPDFAAINAATERAVIATAREAAAGFVFRYFAPQYGNPEDAATGSAAVQLAAYWSARLQVECLTARQLSPQGAEMRLGCHGDAVDLAARVGYR